MIGLLSVILAFAVFTVMSVTFGVDSRTDSSDPRRSEYPVGLN
jgi:hypothetical protein